MSRQLSEPRSPHSLAYIDSLLSFWYFVPSVKLKPGIKMPLVLPVDRPFASVQGIVLELGAACRTAKHPEGFPVSRSKQQTDSPL